MPMDDIEGAGAFDPDGIPAADVIPGDDIDLDAADDLPAPGADDVGDLDAEPGDSPIPTPPDDDGDLG